MITLNGIPVVATRFPDNTCQVWKLEHNLAYGQVEANEQFNVLRPIFKNGKMLIDDKWSNIVSRTELLTS